MTLSVGGFITHVNGIPLIGNSVVVLPSTARVSLPRVMDVTLRYDGEFSFMRTLAQDRASDAFTLTVVDAAGASADATVHLEGQIYVGNFIGYSDSRFAPHLAARTVQIKVRNNHPADSYTVRVESVLFPSIRSNPVTIGNQGVKFIEFLTQGQNLGGTEGRALSSWQMVKRLWAHPSSFHMIPAGSVATGIGASFHSPARPTHPIITSRGLTISFNVLLGIVWV